MNILFKKIAIVGVGLIGGSIGLAVRKKGLAREVVGVCRRKKSMRQALKRGAVEHATLNLEKGISCADLVIIATSVENVKAKIKESVEFVKRGTVIIDVNSTKEGIVVYADKIMPEKIHFIGTHPIAGLEQSGPAFSDARLFENTVCIITPTRHTNKNALKKIKRFWELLGSRVILMSPASHDMAVAKISHLPHILSYNLCSTVSKKDIKIAGSGFKDTTRIAKSEPRMWAEIFLQNRKSLLRSIGDFEKSLSILKSFVIKNKKAHLIKRLNFAKAKRDSVG